MMNTPIFAGVSKDGIFPVRFLGFGFFWTWLFMVTLSPSPVFGTVTCWGGVPFEMAELGARTVLLGLALLSNRWLSTTRGCHVLLACGLACGVLSVPTCMVGGPGATTVAALLAAVSDTSMFLLWLSFFGYMRLGDTLALLVLSYGAGSLLYLALLALDRQALIVAAAILPALSCAAFVMSTRLQASRTGAAIFSVPEQTSGRLSFGGPTAPLVRMTVCLGVFSLGFSLISGLLLATSHEAPDSSTPFAYLTETICIVALAVIYLVLMRVFHRVNAPYVLYHLVPVVMGAGFACLALGMLKPVAVGCVYLGYVMFEVLALNDYCNIVQAHESSLFGTMALGRLVSSAGMMCGWALGYYAAPGWNFPDPQTFTGVAGLLGVLIVSALVFTCREVALMHAVADDRAVQEAPGPKPDRSAALAAYVQQINLSKRETEVLGYLCEGRTTSYIAEKIFLAESTVRAHVHGIYRKAQVGSRMELLDAFEAYCKTLAEGQER